jgi:C-terminal processing protease CtpA/Prc
VLVGATTAGALNGMEASFLDDRHDFLIEVPVSHVTLDGTEIEARGVPPDGRVESPLDRQGGGDPQLDAALEAMRQRLVPR